MNTLPGLLAGACGLWALQTGHWLVAIAAAVALEAPRFLALRWAVEQRHFNRLWDACVALVAGAGILLYIRYGNPLALLLLFQWLPVLGLPLALAQAWGSMPEVDVNAFAWTQRDSPRAERVALNLGYPYLAVWIVAAAAANARSVAFYVALAALVGWALWAARPRHYPVALWAGLIVVAGAAGYGIHHGLHSLQAWITEIVPDWIASSGTRTDPYRSRTDLGSIGELKQDDAIVLRVRVAGRLRMPLLLHRASYNTYVGRTWIARDAPLAPASPEAVARRALHADATPEARVTVFDYAPRGNPVLSLPPDTVALRGIESSSLRRNRLGAVQADLPPGYFTYEALVSPGAAQQGGPNEDDFWIPPNERPLFLGIARRLGLSALPPAQAVAAVKRYFASGFTYSLYRARSRDARSPLADFLLRTRAGHCEYFATATVLLLRTAGLPARYATGFSVDEYSALEAAYVVRVRDAHAWARVYLGGHWVDVDTTPPTWMQAEARAAYSWWVPAADLWSWMRFRLAQLGADPREERRAKGVALGLALVAALWIGWRLSRARRLNSSGGRLRGPAEAQRLPGADSELYLIERKLAQAGLGRQPAETTMAWLARVRSLLPAAAAAGGLLDLARLHYRYRFDPEGLAAPERAELKRSAAQWLRGYARE